MGNVVSGNIKQPVLLNNPELINQWQFRWLTSFLLITQKVASLLCPLCSINLFYTWPHSQFCNIQYTLKNLIEPETLGETYVYSFS